MALSGRYLQSYITLPTAGNVVVLELTGVEGMLRTISSGYSGGGTVPGDRMYKVKIELDGNVLCDDIATILFGTDGMGISGGGANNRLVNIPFNKSIKITVSNTGSTTSLSVLTKADYVIDVKEVV